MLLGSTPELLGSILEHSGSTPKDSGSIVVAPGLNFGVPD